jgi:hypothetical protein
MPHHEHPNGCDTASVNRVTIRPAEPSDVPRMVELLQHGALVEGKEDPSDSGPYLAVSPITGSSPDLITEIPHL